MSTKYTISEIDSGNSHVTVTLEGGTKTTLHVKNDWTTADLDNAVYMWASTVGVPSFISDGAERTYSQKIDAKDTSSSVAIDEAKEERELRLEATDEWMLSDKQALMTDSEKTSLIAYRKELRGLPAAGTSTWNPSFDSNDELTGVTWPTNVAAALLTKNNDQ